MLPENLLSTQVVRGMFNYPDGLKYIPGTDYEMGGIALQDTSQGLQYQPWKGVWDESSGVVSLFPNMTGTPVPIFTQEDVVDFSFTFDQNMRWSAATVDSSGELLFRWYDTVVENYVISEFSGVVAVKLALDDKRTIQIQSGTSDIILTYIKASGGLYFRQQRERYTIERLLESEVTSNLRITNFGMTSKYRLQWQLKSL